MNIFKFFDVSSSTVCTSYIKINVLYVFSSIQKIFNDDNLFLTNLNVYNSLINIYITIIVEL